MIELIFFGIMGGFIFLNDFYDFRNKAITSTPKLSNFNIYERDIFTEYFTKLNNNIINVTKKYNEKINIIKSEIKLLPKDEEFIEFKNLKKQTLKKIEDKKEFEIIEYISKVKKIFPTFIIVKNIYFPVKNKDVIKYYTKLSKKEFGNSNITFVNEDGFKYIINEFYDIFYYKLKYFKNFFKIIDVKTKFSCENKEKYNLADIKRIGD